MKEIQAQPAAEAVKNAEHLSVLLAEFLQFSQLDHSGPLKIWDGTLGLAGHLTAYLQQNPTASGFGSDCDQEMLALARQVIAGQNLSPRVSLRHANYSERPFADSEPFDIVFLDLGVSSLHFDYLERGFSYRFEQSLDMRLDTSRGAPVSDWLNSAAAEEIKKVLWLYGEENFAPQIVRRIVEERQKEPILTTSRLKEICEKAYPAAVKYKKDKHSSRHPYIKTFQALRIFVNRELEHLENALQFLPYTLAPGGRLFIISFHSLEDRLVKHAFQKLEKIPDHSPEARSNYIAGDFFMVTRKAIVASEEEIAANSRARSARLRILERIR